jgi:hypothetical protein
VALQYNFSRAPFREDYSNGIITDFFRNYARRSHIPPLRIDDCNIARLEVCGIAGDEARIPAIGDSRNHETRRRCWPPACGPSKPDFLKPDKRFRPKDKFSALRSYDPRGRQSYQNVSREAFWYDRAAKSDKDRVIVQ